MNVNLKLTGKQILYLLLSGILIIWLGITSISNNRLRNQLNREKINHIEQVDSLKAINQQHLNAIKTYELKLDRLEEIKDSLEKESNNYKKG